MVTKNDFGDQKYVGDQESGFGYDFGNQNLTFGDQSVTFGD